MSGFFGSPSPCNTSGEGFQTTAPPRPTVTMRAACARFRNVSCVTWKAYGAFSHQSGNCETPFCEDRLYGPDELRVSDWSGAICWSHLPACVVPTPDPDSGEPARILKKFMQLRGNCPMANAQRLSFLSIPVNTSFRQRSGKQLRTGTPLNFSRAAQFNHFVNSRQLRALVFSNASGRMQDWRGFRRFSENQRLVCVDACGIC